MISPSPDRIRPLSLAPVVGMGLVGLVAAALLGLRPGDPSTAAGIFPIWWSQGRTFDAAARAGAVVGMGAAPFVAIARSEHGDIVSRLHAAGAWLVIDPGLAKACGA
jgi:hypothetical protein